ncbi:MAG: hypothetical protein ABI389_01360 [Rhodanobacter sp.]
MDAAGDAAVALAQFGYQPAGLSRLLQKVAPNAYRAEARIHKALRAALGS